MVESAVLLLVSSQSLSLCDGRGMQPRLRAEGLDGYGRVKRRDFHGEQKSLTLVNKEYRRLNAGVRVY